MKNFILICLLFPIIGNAQNILYLGGTAHLGNGEKIENAAISVNKGFFDLVANAELIRIDPRDYDTIIHTYNHHIYPGFISTNTTLGITEISAVRATRDFNEVGNYKPHVRSLIAFNIESKIIPTIRTNGVLMAQVCPQGGRISGTSSVMKLDGWNWEDAVQKIDNGLHLNWPKYYKQTGWWAQPGIIKKTDNYQSHIQELEDYIIRSKSYYESNSEKNDLEMMAMRGIFNGEKTLFIHANLQREITDAVLFAKKFDIPKIAIIGAKEAHKMIDFLKSNETSVILDRIHRLPQSQDSDIDMPYKQAALLDNAGIKFSFCYQGDMEAMGQRNLPFSAGTAVAYGLPYEHAVRALTLYPAQMLGIDDEVGSIEKGKQATFFISKGDALDMIGNDVKMAFIKGNPINLDNHQKALDRKYREKYGLKVVQ